MAIRQIVAARSLICRPCQRLVTLLKSGDARFCSLQRRPKSVVPSFASSAASLPGPRPLRAAAAAAPHDESVASLYLSDRRPILDGRLEPWIIYRRCLSSVTSSASALRERRFCTTIVQPDAAAPVETPRGISKPPKPKIFQEEQHPLKDHLILRPAWKVLSTLKNAGHECYLVGGSVRDLYLQKVPKDFDVLSTASLREVKQLFPRCYIVGKRFPIVHVHMMGQIIEVSTFEETSSKTMERFSEHRGQPNGNEDREEEVGGISTKKTLDLRDHARQLNAFKRDFTINGLLYDPFERILYDYVGGVRDLQRPTIRTIIPAEESFEEDPARILRAVRVAARLGFPLESSTSKALERHAPAVLSISKSRSMLELNIMMAYGSAEASVRILWRYRLLEMLLPFHASYFVSLNFKRQARKSNFLLDVLRTLDQVTSPDRPCDGSLWVALVAFHLAAAELLPRTVVMAAAALACSDRRGLQDAAKRARAVYERIESDARKAAEKEKTGKTDEDTSSVSEKKAPEHGKGSEPEDEEESGAEAGVNEDGTPKSNPATAGGAAGLTGPLKAVVRESKELGTVALAALHKMTDSSLAGKEILDLSGLQGHGQVLFTKTHIFKAECILRCITDNVNLQKKGSKEGDRELYVDVDRDVWESAFIFSRIILNTIFPRTFR